MVQRSCSPYHGMIITSSPDREAAERRSMQDTEILSTFQEPETPPGSAAPLLPACQVGVVLRSVGLVEGVLAVAAQYGAASVWGWLIRWADLSGVALPATVAWLVLACLGRHWLARRSLAWQAGLLVGVGAGCAIYGAGLMQWLGLLPRPPWVACASTGAALAAAILAMQLMRERSKTPAATQARLAELQSRIRPHFLFNTLNSAIALVRAEPARAEALLEDLSDLFRHALREQEAAVTLADEITLARRYLAIEQVRFGDRLQLEWALDPQAQQALLPPLLLQPLVENAVRHGVEPSAQGARVRISSQRRGQRVVIKVTNTVPSGPGVQGHGVALANVRDRLRLLHDWQGQFRHGLRDGVFQVRIEVPA